MKISPLRLFIFLFWSAMMVWLIRSEAFPKRFKSGFADYSSLFQGKPFILDSWMRITHSGEPIGYSHTWMDSDSRQGSESHSILNRTILSLNMMGEHQQISVLSSTTLDENYSMRDFLTVLQSGFYKTRVEGRRIEGDNFEASVETPVSTNKFSLRIPDDCVVHSPMMDMAVRGLRPGGTLKFRTLDPITMKFSEVVVEALRRERISHGGRAVKATALKISYMGLDMLSWVDEEGEILRHETPFGWEMTACSPEEALSGFSERPAADILSSSAVLCVGRVENPRSSESLTVFFEGLPFDLESLTTPRQRVELDGGRMKMTVTSQSVPSRSLLRSDSLPKASLAFLEPSSFIQSDHPDIVEAARSMTEESQDLFEAALAISSWVRANIRMQPTFSLPSALDVFAQRVGDCNEITQLFVALARASGIPARVHTGLVYGSSSGLDAFYYHAWPSVFVGEWVEMDPTFGQATVDAAHITLVVGELEDQLRLLPMMGQAKAEIVREESGP